MRPAALLVVAAVLASPLVVAPPAGASGPAVVAAYPNPVADGDAGEFVVVRTAGVTNLTLTDGEDAVALPARAGRVAVTSAPDRARNLTDLPVVEGDLTLANGGERIRLLRAGRELDAVVYESAPEGERWLADEGWRPLGYEPRPVRTFGGACATAFVLPDAPDVAVETVRSARERVLLAGYTFGSRRVADALVAASERGVRVRVLLEGDPVGDRSARAARLLDRLAAAGVEVRVVAGPYARFRYHHAKYAVVDDRALVLTENWKPAGVGGRSSRGWGVRVDAAPVADELAALFRADAAWRGAVRWQSYRRGRTFESVPAANGSFPRRHEARGVRVEQVAVLTAPGNAERAVVERIDAADDRVDVVQPSVAPESPLVRATVRAARRGVRVRILLSGAWYTAEENRALAARLNDRASARDLPLEVRVAEPRGRFEKIHAKGVVVDDTVLLGSLNWNEVSARENREVVVALRGERVARYYADVFASDWRGDRRTPTGFLLAAALAVGLAVVALRRAL